MTSEDKLELIMEHAKSYYDYGRKYYFVKGGFLVYELTENSIYFHDIYVSNKTGNKYTYLNLIKFGKSFRGKVDYGFLRIGKDNYHYASMLSVYTKMGWEVYYDDDNESLLMYSEKK